MDVRFISFDVGWMYAFQLYGVGICFLGFGLGGGLGADGVVS